MKKNELYTLGIDIGSTTVKIAVLGADNEVLFSDYERHFANIQETLSDLLGRAIYKLGPIHVSPVITGSEADSCHPPACSVCTGSDCGFHRFAGLCTSD